MTRTLLLLATIALALPAAAQETRHLSLSAGIAEFDLSGTGTEAAFEARLGHTLAGPLDLDVGVGLLRPRQQFGERTTFWQADVLLQLTRRSGTLRPYGGLGLGTAADVRSGEVGGTDWSLVTAGAAGVRFALTERGGLQAEGRLRLIGTGFNGTVGQLTLGWFQHF